MKKVNCLYYMISINGSHKMYLYKSKDVFCSLLKMFKDGEISRKTYTDVWKTLFSNSKLKVRKRTKLYDIIWNELPDIELYCVLEPGNEEDQEFEFRKAIIRWEYLIKYGCTREELYERTVLARIMSERHDPVEDSEKYMRVGLDVERKVKKEIGEGGYMGYCHLYWSVKKRILKEEYGIEWGSPQELNPDIMFD